MGQDLFSPPNVGGWPEGRSWLGSRSIVARANFAAALVERRLWTKTTSPDPCHAVPEMHRKGDLEDAIRAFAELLWGQAEPSVVEECLTAINDVKEPEEKLVSAMYWIITRPESQLG
jgi:hypothetical protein